MQKIALAYSAPLRIINRKNIVLCRSKPQMVFIITYRYKHAFGISQLHESKIHF